MPRKARARSTFGSRLERAQARTDEIVDRAIAEPEGTLRRMERDLLGDAP